MDTMTKEGYNEATNNRRLGKRVIHSDVTNKKLVEVQKALDFDDVVDTNETHNKSNHLESHAVTNRWNTSTFGALHSIGSDLTRTRGRSDLHQNGSNTSDPTVSRLRENGHNTPTALIESYTAGTEKGRNGKINEEDKMDTVVCSRSTLDKRSRKASTVRGWEDDKL